MNIVITHECSGRVREEMRKLGHNAWSCDLKPADDRSPFHIQGDAIIAIKSGPPTGGRWHLIGMHPDCTYLTVAGIHWNNRGRGHEKTEQAMQHVFDCRDAATVAGAKWYLENPVSIISTRWRKPDQIISPHRFGDDASKATCLWLHGLPLLREWPHGDWVRPRWNCSKCKRTIPDDEAQCWMDQRCSPRCRYCADTPRLLPRWANQTDSGQNRLGPSKTRAAERAITYPGIAKAMAEQWAGHLVTEDWS